MRFSAESPCRQWTLWPLPDLFTAFCMTSGIPSLDLTELFQNAVASGEMPYAVADTHWGPEGHALVARRLAEEISRRGLARDEWHHSGRQRDGPDWAVIWEV